MWFSLLLATAFFAHDFHVSIAQADYKAGEIQMTLRVFTDDLEMTLEERGAKNLRLGTPQEFAEADALIAGYLKERVRFELGDQSLPMTFVGKEVEYDLCYLYLSFNCPKTPEELSVSNQVFFDSFEDQSNIVNVKVGDNLRSAFLSRGNTKETLVFK